MTPEELENLVEQYRAGLEAQVALLRRLEWVATRQREVTEARDFERFSAESDERDRLTQSLITIEEGLSRAREVLAKARKEVTALDTFRDVMALRQAAAELVARILATDRDSMKSLTDAELARRAALASLEHGETTLAAYRKVLVPPVSPAALLNRRG